MLHCSQGQTPEAQTAIMESSSKPIFASSQDIAVQKTNHIYAL